MNRLSMFGYAILALIVIGIAAQFFNNPASMIIPLTVFGIVFYLYKFPPKRNRNNSSPFQVSSRSKPKNKRKIAPFRVIDGKKNGGDENPPPYH